MDDPLIGKRIGPYEIRAPLGRGGMAQVYRAFDHDLHREVAFKVLHGPGQQSDFAERFMREAQTLASLKHPVIVHIYNVGRHEELSYIVQELLPGPTLEDELATLRRQGKSMDSAEIQRVIDQLAGALDYAHQRGIIHRDLKPSNIIRNERGGVVLVDFGIAKSLTSVDKLTRTGIVMGTPTYLAPEQAMGSDALTPAVDVYALGVILFELLTGQVPFADPSPLSVALAHLSQEPPSVCSLRVDLPPAVEAVVLRALAKEPGARHSSAGALAKALAAAWGPGAASRAADNPARASAARKADIHHAATTVNPALANQPPAGRPASADLHQAQTTVNPALAGGAPAAGQRLHNAPTTVNPALAGAARRPAGASPGLHQAQTTVNPAPGAQPQASQASRSANWPRWAAIIGVLLLACLIGRALVNKISSSVAITGEEVAGQPTPNGATGPAENPTPSGATPAPQATTPPAAQAAPPEAIVAQASAVIDRALGDQQLTEKAAKDLQKKLEDVEEKLAEGKSKDVEEKVRELRKKIDEAERKGQMASGPATELRALVDQLGN